MSKTFVIRFVSLFLPAFIFTAGIVSIFTDELEKKNIRTFEQNNLYELKLKRENLLKKLQTIGSDLNFLTNLVELSKPDNSSDFKKLRKNFRLFCKSKRMYDYICFVNREGEEVVRVDLNNEKPAITRAPPSSGKKKEYDWKGLKLKRGELYISPFVLDTERGNIKYPLKPVIRLSSPVYTKDSKFMGTLAVSYMGDKLLEVFHDLDTVVSPVSKNYMLLNSDGYWLHSSRQEDMWGFMFARRMDKNFKKEYPHMWERVKTNTSGHLYNRSGDLFVFDTVFPAFDIQKAKKPDIRISNHLKDIYYWKIVHRIQSKYVQAFSYKGMKVAVNTFVGIMFAATSWFMALAGAKKEEAERETLRKYEVQSLFNKMLKISLSSSKLQETLDRTLELIVSIPYLPLQTSGCIFLVEDKPNTLVMKSCYNLSDELQSRCSQVSFGECFCGKAALSKKIIFESSLSHMTLPSTQTEHSHYCVPLLFSDNVLGVLNLYVKAGHQSSEEERDLLQAIADILVGVIRRKQVEGAYCLRLVYLEHMDKINQIIQASTDMDDMLSKVIGKVMEIFDCDRAWLLFPCDPLAKSWRVPIERAKPEYPGVFLSNASIPMAPGAAEIFKTALESEEAIVFGPENERPLEEVAKKFQVRSQIVMAIYPKIGQTWLFGAHQCSYTRTWTDMERSFFKEIGHRLADGLSSLLFLNNLRESELKYRTLVENIPQKIFIKDKNLVYISCNKNYASDLKIKSGEIRGKTDYDYFPKEIAEKYRVDDKRILRSNIAESIEEPYILDGKKIYVQIIKTPVRDKNNVVFGILGIFWDITERKEAEKEIKRSLKEKEVLLQEVHHRVKNNLQIVSSLLNLQAHSIKNTQDRNIFRDTINRVKSIALVHEKLYKSNDLSNVDIRSYVHGLTHNIAMSYGGMSSRIKLHESITNIHLDIKRIIPCGLIINELVSNSFKHAFPNTLHGRVDIILSSDGGEFSLTVKDDGVEFPKDFNFRETDTLGMQLVTSLAESELKGHISHHGKNFTITFKQTQHN